MTTTTTTLGRNAIGQTVATAIMDHVAKNLLAKWNPKTHGGITREQAIDAARQVFGYVPPSAWSYSTPHPFYGPRNVGRPAPKSAAPVKSSAKSSGRKSTPTAAKSSTARKGAAAKSAAAKSSATPATVARRVAAKSSTAAKSAA